MNIPLPIMKASSQVSKFFIKHGPRIMSVSGGIMAVGGAVMACRATLHADEVLDAHRERMAQIHEAEEVARLSESSIYTPQMIRRDKAIVYAETAVGFAKLYGPSIAVGMAGVGLMQGAFGIMDKRHSTTLAALTALDQAYTELATKTQAMRQPTEVSEIDENGERPKAYAIKTEFDDDPDSVLCKEYIPIEDFSILEDDPFTIVVDARSEVWIGQNQYAYNASCLRSILDQFEYKRQSYRVPAVWVNDIRRAFYAPEKRLGWSNGYLNEPGDSILYDIIPCVYDTVDGIVVGARPLYAETGCPEYDKLDDGMKEHIDLLDDEVKQRIALLKTVEEAENDNYCVVIRLLGSGPTGEPAYIRNKVLG